MSFQGVSLSLIPGVDDIPDFFCLKIPVPAENIADHFSRFPELDGVEFPGVHAIFQVFPAVFIGDSRIALKLVVPEL